MAEITLFRLPSDVEVLDLSFVARLAFHPEDFFAISKNTEAIIPYYSQAKRDVEISGQLVRSSPLDVAADFVAVIWKRPEFAKILYDFAIAVPGGLISWSTAGDYVLFDGLFSRGRKVHQVRFERVHLYPNWHVLSHPCKRDNLFVFLKGQKSTKVFLCEDSAARGLILPSVPRNAERIVCKASMEHISLVVEDNVLIVAWAQRSSDIDQIFLSLCVHVSILPEVG